MKKTYKIILTSLFFLIVLAFIVVSNFEEIKFGYNMFNTYKNKENISEAQTREKLDNIEVDNPLKKEIINNEANKKEYVEVLRKYDTDFDALKMEFEIKLNSMLKLAYKEYQTGSSKNELALKYLKKGSNLEAQCDEKFEYLINNMDKNLKLKEMDNSIKNELTKYYSNYKSLKREELINKSNEYK